MKFVAIQGRVLKPPLSRATRNGQLMCFFRLVGESVLDWFDSDMADRAMRLISVACWGEVATAALALRPDERLLVYIRVSGYRWLSSAGDPHTDTLVVDALALGLDLAGELQDLRKESHSDRALAEQRRRAVMAVHPAGRGRYADALDSEHEVAAATDDSTSSGTRRKREGNFRD